MKNRKYSTLLLVCAGLVPVVASAQRMPESRQGLLAPSGQDLSTMGAPAVPGRPLRGLAAERQARARRQAEFRHDYPGTPLRPFAVAPGGRPRQGASNGAL